MRRVEQSESYLGDDMVGDKKYDVEENEHLEASMPQRVETND